MVENHPEIYLHSLGNSERQAMAVFEQVSVVSHTDSHTASHFLQPIHNRIQGIGEQLLKTFIFLYGPDSLPPRLRA